TISTVASTVYTNTSINATLSTRRYDLPCADEPPCVFKPGATILLLALTFREQPGHATFLERCTRPSGICFVPGNASLDNGADRLDPFDHRRVQLSVVG